MGSMFSVIASIMIMMVTETRRKTMGRREQEEGEEEEEEGEAGLAVDASLLEGVSGKEEVGLSNLSIRGAYAQCRCGAVCLVQSVLCTVARLGSNGRIIAFQAIGSGSTPDRCTNCRRDASTPAKSLRIVDDV